MICAWCSKEKSETGTVPVTGFEKTLEEARTAGVSLSPGDLLHVACLKKVVRRIERRKDVNKIWTPNV